jgi:hypothetical protein
MFADRPDGAVDRSVAPCGNFRNEFTGRGKRCESLSPASAQKGVDAACATGEDCGVSVALGVLAAASALAIPLPKLPAQGVAVADRGGVTFVDFAGRRLARLPGYQFAGQDTNVGVGFPRLRDRAGGLWRLDIASRRLLPGGAGTPLHGGATLTFRRATRTWVVQRRGRLLLRMRVGREFPFLSEDGDIVSTGRRALDLRMGRMVRVPRSCRVASRRTARWTLLCGRAASGYPLPTSIESLVNGRRQRIVGPPVGRGPDGRIHGHWRYVLVAPDGRRLLAQWSGECEIPHAFLVEGGKLRPFGAVSYADAPESGALGWLRGGDAVVHFPVSACGGSRSKPGVYVVPTSGKPRLVVATGRAAGAAMWGG